MRLFPCLLLAIACSSGPEPVPEETDAPAVVTPWPDWAFSHWVWEDESTQESATALVDGYLSRGIPVGAIIIDSPWATGYSTFQFNPELFPDPQAFVDDMHSKDVRVFLWTVPGINIEETALHQTGTVNKWFMQANADDGPAVIPWWKGEGSLIDYHNPEAVTWWHGLLDGALDLGIDGWKCDGLDFSAISAPYSPGAGRDIERLEYSAAYYQDFHDYTRERLGEDRLITSRPIDNYGADIGGDGVAFTPPEIAWASWVGDQDASFEGIKAALRNFYWSADYGYVAFGSDIGGYREDGSERGRTKTVFLRWAQLGAFSPIMENGGGGVHEPWLFDVGVVKIYKRFVLLHEAIRPYLDREGAAAFAAGRSLMTFQSKSTYEYLLGPDLYVAPMTAPGTQRTVLFPAVGQWEYLFDRTQVYEAGETATLEIPMDEYPVFVRRGSTIAGEL